MRYKNVGYSASENPSLILMKDLSLYEYPCPPEVGRVHFAPQTGLKLEFTYFLVLYSVYTITMVAHKKKGR